MAQPKLGSRHEAVGVHTVTNSEDENDYLRLDGVDYHAFQAL